MLIDWFAHWYMSRWLYLMQETRPTYVNALAISKYKQPLRRTMRSVNRNR